MHLMSALINNQAFVPAVLLMSVFEQRLSFQMSLNVGEGSMVLQAAQQVYDRTLVGIIG